MNKKIFLLCIMTILLTGFDSTTYNCENPRVETKPVSESLNKHVEEIVTETTATVEEVTTIEEEPVLPYSDEEIDLLALVTMAEAEGEPDDGKRLVIDTILNRVDHERFPDTIHDVVYQSGQFTSMWNGRVDRCYVKDDIYQLVLEELEHRTNYDTIFFHAGRYSSYGTPIFQVGNHYFSSYN